MPDPNHFGCWCSQHRLSARSNNLGRCSLIVNIEGKTCSKLLDKICFKCGAHKHPTNFKARHLKKGCSDEDIQMWNDALLGIEIPDKFVFDVAQEFKRRGPDYFHQKKRISIDSQMMEMQKEQLNEANKRIQELILVEKAKEEIQRESQMMKGAQKKEDKLRELQRTQMRPVYDREIFESEVNESLMILDSELSNKYQHLESSTIDQFFHILSLKHSRIMCISSAVFRQGTDQREGMREYYSKSVGLLEDQKIDYILAPRHINGDHWCLLIFEKEGSMFMFDPKYHHQNYNDKVFKHLMVIFGISIPVENQIKSCLNGLQKDDYSCGPWICRYAELLVENKKKPSLKLMKDQMKGLNKYRRKILKECMEAIKTGGSSSVFRSLDN